MKNYLISIEQINSTLVHRDIKPDNILVSGNIIKISDFGLSKLAAENTRTLTFKGGGTLLYMSPEAFDFSKNTMQMDIYAMGIVFYELATLLYPYEPIPKTYEESKNTHLYSAIKTLAAVNSSLSASVISVINRMLEKPTQKRFANWDEIIHLLELNEETVSPLDQIISRAISAKNAEDITRQAQISEERKKAKEKEEFCKLVYTQLDNTILIPIRSFADKFNEQYAGGDKYSFPNNIGSMRTSTGFSWKLKTPHNTTITLNAEAILKENHTRKVHIDRFWGEEGYRTENYIPQYKNKNILLWCEIVSSKKHGFNLLLLDGSGIYGDWIIMNNKNNFSTLSGRERIEPFAFSLDELPKEIDSVQVTHLYRAEFEDFSEERLLNLISLLASGL